MPLFNSHDLAIHGSTFNDVQGDIINYYSIQQSQLGILCLLKHISVDATHDSRGRPPPAKYVPGTRTAELESISQWVRASGQESSVLWVHGPANIEKSVISQTVAESCEKLVASFFFSRSKPDCNSSVKFWATIAFQMAMLIPGLGNSVQNAVSKRPGIFSKASAVQVKRLIIEPLLDARINDLQPELRFLVIVDSLEDCKKKEQGDLLKSIARITHTRHPLLFLITSHPALEPRIRDSFGKCPIMHLNLSDPHGILSGLWSEPAPSASEDTTRVRSLVFGNNNPVPPPRPIFDKSRVSLTDSLDLSHLTELSLWDMDIKTHPAMQAAVEAGSESVQTFIWRFNLNTPPKSFNPDPVALVRMPNLRHIVIEMNIDMTLVAGDPLSWLANSMNGFPVASAGQFEALAIVIVTNRFSGIGNPDHVSLYVSHYHLLTAIDTILCTARYQKLRAVKIYVTGININGGRADLRSDIEKLMPRLLAKGVLKVELIGRYNEDVDFEVIRTSLRLHA